MSPRAMRAWSAAKLGSKRRLNATNSGTFAFFTAARHWSTRFSERSMGFSQKIALPAFAAAMISSACVSVDDAMITASISGSPSAVTTSVTCAPCFAARAAAAAGFTSTT